jgi:hypothetical protein
LAGNEQLPPGNWQHQLMTKNATGRPSEQAGQPNPFELKCNFPHCANRQVLAVHSSLSLLSLVEVVGEILGNKYMVILLWLVNIQNWLGQSFKGPRSATNQNCSNYYFKGQLVSIFSMFVSGPPAEFYLA